MNSDTDFPHQPDTIQQQPPSSFKPRKPPAFFTTVLLIALVAGTGGYLLGVRNNQFNPPSLPSATPKPTMTTQISATTDTTTTVTIQDDYFFKVTIPHGYALTKRSGDAIQYVTDENGENIIAFYIYSGLGESHPTGQIVIDGVPFIIDGGDIDCSADIYATNAQFKLDHLYFGIYTYCKDAHKEQSGVYERVIRSIQFSEDLRAVLLGKSPPPILRY